MLITEVGVTLPSTMNFIDHGEVGPASCLQMRQCAVPELKSGEVLIEVAYAGVYRPDIMQRAGLYPPPPDASPILGLEVAGKVVARADDVTSLKNGDTVCAGRCCPGDHRAWRGLGLRGAGKSAHD